MESLHNIRRALLDKELEFWYGIRKHKQIQCSQYWWTRTVTHALKVQNLTVCILKVWLRYQCDFTDNTWNMKLYNGAEWTQRVWKNSHKNLHNISSLTVLVHESLTTYVCTSVTDLKINKQDFHFFLHFCSYPNCKKTVMG